MDAHRKAIIHGSGQSRWRTPLAMVERLLTVFPIQFDLAATLQDRVVPLYLGPDHPRENLQDALAVCWREEADRRGVPPYGFLNPPYSLSEIRELRAEQATLSLNPDDEEAASRGSALEAQIRALRIEEWARKAFNEAEAGFTTIGVFPYSPQTEWFRWYVMGHGATGNWRGHAALDYWRIPHRVSYLQPDGTPSNNAGVNTCVIHWGPNPGFVGPWVPSGRYWSFR